MGDPEVKAKRSASRKRNYVAKKMWEETKDIRRIHQSEKDKTKQRKWRYDNDPDGDYDNLDDWLMRNG